MQAYTGGQVQVGRVMLTPASPAASPMEQALGLGLSWAHRGRMPVALLVLRLSTLHQPGPRPHHRRVAANLLEGTVQTHGGQVFACPNGDLALVSEPAAAARLAATLSALFRVESPGADRLLSLWSLPADEAAARGSLGPAGEHLPPLAELPVPLGAVAAAEAVLASAPFDQLVRRQTAVSLGRAGLVPLYQELTVSLAALEARMSIAAPFAADPFLLRHLAARLDQRVLERSRAGLPAHGAAVHINLTLAGILSPAFAHLAPGLGIEADFMEAVSDLPRFAAAAARVRAAGCRLVLDGVDHAVMALARPRALEPDLLKLDWSPRMATLPGRERRLLDASVEAMGPERIVLHRAETEAALAWGLARGVTRFQGRHVDAMLAAGRIGACRHASACTLRQCIDRGAAASPGERAGCRDLALLDAGVPAAARTAA